MENRLYRDKARGIAGGVASGLGLYLKIDPILVRCLFIIIALRGHTGVVSALVVYGVLWIAIPPLPVGYLPQALVADYRVDPVTGQPLHTLAPQHRSTSSRIFGFILLGLGIVFLADRFIDFDWDFERYWPALLIFAGLGLLITNGRRNPPPTGASTTPMTAQPGVPLTDTSTSVHPTDTN